MRRSLLLVAAAVAVLATATAARLGDGSGGQAGTEFGATISVRAGETVDEAVTRVDDEIGPPPVVRLYAAGLPPEWSELERRAGEADVVVSFKADPERVIDGAVDDRMEEWFGSLPDDRDIYWAYFHEPEDDIEAGSFTAAAYVAAWAHLDALADQSRNARLHSAVVLMCWTLDKESGRRWSDYVPNPSPDVLTWDCYNRPRDPDDGYARPRDLLAASVEASQRAGSRWAIGELGSELVPGDDGEGRADWLRAIADYSRDRDAVFVTYFHALIDGDYALTDPASQEAWREIMAS